MIAGAGTNSSRPSTHKSTSPSDPEIPASERIEDRVDEFLELYPAKARTKVVLEGAADPREAVRLRRDATEHRPVVHEGALVEGEFYPLTWAEVLRAHLEWFEEVRDLEGRFVDADGDTWTRRFLNSYHPEYLEKHYAQLKGLHRSIAGGELPDGTYLEGDWTDPRTALITLTSSGTDDEGRPRGPVDHQTERREAWPPVYKRLYDTLEGLVDEGRIADWLYVVVEEHHPGPFKENTCLGHDHVVVLVDGEIVADDFAPAVATWIDSCPNADRGPHHIGDCVDVRRIDPDASEGFEEGGPINGAGDYLIKYLYPEGGADVLDRPIEQLAHHSIKWATNTRRLRKSDRAGEAIRADRCRQAYRGAGVHPHEQQHDHAERLEHRREGRGAEIVCAECGSSWGIDQGAETIVEARRSADVDENPGETSVKPPSGGEVLIKPTPKERLAVAWGDAPAAARIDEEGLTSVDRPPPARLEAYIVDGEEHLVTSSGGGVEMVPVFTGADDEVFTQNGRHERIQSMVRTLEEPTIDDVVDALPVRGDQVRHDVDRMLERGELMDVGHLVNT